MIFVHKVNQSDIKKNIAYVIILIILLSVSGCRNKSENVDNEINNSKTVIDHANREVVISVDAERIIALNPLIMDGLFAIGIPPIGKVDEYKIREEGVSLPSVGSQKNVNIEAIYDLKPDLIFAHVRSHGQIIQSLEETGAIVYVFDPGKFGDNPMLDSASFLGNLLDRQKEAQAYLTSVNQISKKLKEQVQTKTEIRSGLIIRNADTIFAVQNATSYGSILNALGIRNIVPDNLPGASKESFVPFDIETIIAEDPDIILVMASGNNTEQNKKVIQKFKNDPKWENLTAVKENRIMTLPFKVNPGKSTAEEMIRITAKLILSETEKN